MCESGGSTLLAGPYPKLLHAVGAYPFLISFLGCIGVVLASQVAAADRTGDMLDKIRTLELGACVLNACKVALNVPGKNPMGGVVGKGS